MRMSDERLKLALMGKTYWCAAAVAVAMITVTADRGFAQPTPGQPAEAENAKALPFVSSIFGDNMVLQRGKPDTIWGWADPGESVRVQIGEKAASAVAGTDRRWQVMRGNRIRPPHSSTERDCPRHLSVQTNGPARQRVPGRVEACTF
jgi:hypothetical protein